MGLRVRYAEMMDCSFYTIDLEEALFKEEVQMGHRAVGSAE